MTTEPMVRLIAVKCPMCGYENNKTYRGSEALLMGVLPVAEIRRWATIDHICTECGRFVKPLFATEPAP